MIKKIKFIDLDLPSKNLWASKTLPGYYAWGEIIPKEKFYKHNFNINKHNGIVTLTLGKNYKIPGKKDFEELLECTDRKCFPKKGIIKFLSKNNNKILTINARGFYSGEFIIDDKQYINLWTSTEIDELTAYATSISVQEDYPHTYFMYSDLTSFHKSLGLKILPVYNKA